MRRRFTLLLTLLLLLSVSSLALAEGAAFIVATDMHIIAPELTDMGEYFTRTYENGDGKVMRYADEVMRAFLSEVIAAKPDGLILSGDITFEGAKKSHEYVASLLAEVREAGIAVYVMPGNHDIQNPVSAQYLGDRYTLVESVTPAEFAEVYNDYGFSSAIARDNASLSYAAQIAPGIRLLAIDTNMPATPNAFSEETYAFVIEQLKAAQDAGDQVLTVTHQNVLSHNDLFNAGLFGEGFMINEAEKLQTLMEGTDTIANLSGHMHIQHIEKSEGGLIDIATSSLVVSPCQYGVLELNDGEASYRTEIVDVSAWAEKNGADDEQLLDFAAYARTFFSSTASRSGYSLAEDVEDREYLINAYLDLHAAYFAGRLDTIELDEERFSPWLQKAGLFTYMYLTSILEEDFIDHTKLTFAY